MNKQKLLYLILVLLLKNIFCQFSQSFGNESDSTYCNPIIPADFSDIDVIKVNNDYYAISSTFQYSPGMAVLHSTDLINWRVINHVVKDITSISPELNWDKMNRYGRGIWAGSIRYYKNKFWVYFGTPDEGFFMSSATNPAGEWEPLHCIWRIEGWDDCCTLYDEEEDQIYFIASNFKTDPKNGKSYNIHIFKLSPDGKQIFFNTDSIIYQNRGSEANKLYKFNGMYYHLFSEIHPEGRVVMIRRAKNIYGPYEKKQIIHVNKNVDREPNQGGFVQDDCGNFYFLTHHGTTGYWEGRTVSLLPVKWINGWPIIGTVGSDTIGNMVWCSTKPKIFNSLNKKNDDYKTIYDFNEKNLEPEWEWNYQPRNDKWSLSVKPGYLRLYAFLPLNPENKNKIILRAGNTLTQRSYKTTNSEVIIKVDISNMVDGQYAGLTHYASTYSLFGIKVKDDKKFIFFDNNGKDTTGNIISNKIIWLKSTWTYEGINQYFYSTDGINFMTFGSEYKLSWGNYRGDRIGIFNFNIEENKGFIDVDEFIYLRRKF
jgi:beta-xylosidase